MIDLHAHTNLSDGEHPPEELVRLAHERGVRVLAVTDHDTVAGLPRAKQAASALGVRLVSGIEVSAFLNRREIHILGHFVREAEPRLAAYAHRLGGERRERMEAMVERMQALGYPVRMDEVLAIAQDAHLARPHLAQLLVKRGYCLTVKEAFDRFLGAGGPAYVDRFRLPAAEAIELIRGAGGAATVAHPGVSQIERHDLEELTRAGLSGLEVLHKDHVPSQREKYLAISKELGLVPTAGSDYHGPTVTPDRHLGSETMTEEALERLRTTAAAP